jgi:hypothetical protein
MPFMFAGTMLAGPGKIADFGIGVRFAVGQPVNLHPGDADQFIGFVLPERDVVFGHTGHHAGAATGTFVQVDDHAITFGLTEIARVFHQNLVLLN